MLYLSLSILTLEFFKDFLLNFDTYAIKTMRGNYGRIAGNQLPGHILLLFTVP